MKIQVLGGHGGQAKGLATTSFLIDDKLLIDAGAVASALTVEEQVAIDHILISHCHLDHIKDLAFMSDNCFGLKDRPFKVYTHATVKKIIKDHLLNNIIWPDFTELPSKEKPTLQLFDIPDGKHFKLGDYGITPIKVNHDLDAMGFIIEDGESTVLFTLDTGPTEEIWKEAKKVKNLKAIFTEVSFPNELQNVADLSLHHTPKTIALEIKKMPSDIPIILTHLKPNYRSQILSELKLNNESRIRVLSHDGEEFNF